MVKNIFIFLLITSFLFYIFNKNIEIYRFGKNSSNVKRILIIGGTHGNEPSSSLSLYLLIHYLRQKNIHPNVYITIIPMINKTGFYTNNRYSYHFLKNYDINRHYPKKFYINKILKEFIKEADLVIDHHEGYHYHVDNKQSIGSTLSPFNMNKTSLQFILDKLNRNINKKFVFNSKKTVPKHSLRYYIQQQFPEKEYLLIETTGINNPEPLKMRQFKALYIIISLLNNRNILMD